jgi:hypothetical protein
VAEGGNQIIVGEGGGVVVPVGNANRSESIHGAQEANIEEIKKRRKRFRKVMIFL